VLPHGASSKEKALLPIHPRSSERGILAFSRNRIQGAGNSLNGILADHIHIYRYGLLENC